MSTFGTVAHDIVARAETLKAAVLKILSHVPAIAGDLTQLETVANGILSEVAPGDAMVADAVEAVISKIFTAVDSAGPSITANGMNIMLDIDTIKKVQAALPSLKTAKS